MTVRKHPPVRRLRLGRNNELSAKQSATLISQIKKQGMRALFVENRSDPRLLKRIADKADRSARRQLYQPVPLQRARDGEKLT